MWLRNSHVHDMAKGWTETVENLEFGKKKLYPRVLPYKRNGVLITTLETDYSKSDGGWVRLLQLAHWIFFFTITASIGFILGSSPLHEFFYRIFFGVKSPAGAWEGWRCGVGGGFYSCNLNLDTRHNLILPGTCFKQIIFCFTESFCFTVKIILQGRGS